MGLFEELLILLGCAVVVVGLLGRLRLPVIPGYLILGVILGPYAAGLFQDNNYINAVAQFGVVFLMFIIGLKLSVTEFRHFGLRLVVVGAAQVLITTLVFAAGAIMFGMAWGAALAVGAILTQSSSSIIAKQLADQGEEQAPHGRLSLGVSVFQDITTVPFVLLITVLGTGEVGNDEGASLLVKLVLGVVLAVLLWRYGGRVLRPAFHHIAAARSQELFTLAALLTVIAAAWLTESVGFSLALGAFVAGLLIGETEYRTQVESSVKPFRDVLLGLFFASIGMLLDYRILLEFWWQIILLAVVILAVKTTIVALAAGPVFRDWRLGLRIALVLAVGGEFGFALLTLALDGKVLVLEQTQLLLGAVVLSMLIAPALIRYNRYVDVRPGAAGSEGLSGSSGLPPIPEIGPDPVLICGFGRVGQNVARFLTKAGINWVAVDLDHLRVEDSVLAGHPVIYGDCSEPALLESLDITRYRLVVISFVSLSAAKLIIGEVRRQTADVPVLVRTADDQSLDVLEEVGATETVPETLEAAITLSSHALTLAGVHPQISRRLIAHARRERYRQLREVIPGHDIDFDADFLAGEYLLPVKLPASSPLEGQPLSALSLDDNRVQVTGMRRSDGYTVDVNADPRLKEGDVLLLYGPADSLADVRARIDRLR